MIPSQEPALSFGHLDHVFAQTADGHLRQILVVPRQCHALVALKFKLVAYQHEFSHNLGRKETFPRYD